MSYDPARVKSLFLAASDLASPRERAAYLDRECGDDPELLARVEVLLAAEDRAGPALLDAPRPEPGEFATLPDVLAETLGRSIAPAGADSEATVAVGGDGEPGVTIGGAEPGPTSAGFAPGGVVAGRYTLLGVLGEGGMGTVYLAEQTSPVRRQVALKLIRTGMDSRSVLARFDAERQALAMMDHPNIARVYDAGATESGQPFFAMEYVRGEPITDYCDRNRLPVEARLRLLVDACQAVQHAHQKGIIHRDIKPTNVLVAEVDGRPTPKVIDFGVAKASGFELTDRTLGDTGAIVGTPTYMSPEQADPSSMDIDTRPDVYALGVLLYELLAGSPPIDPAQFRRGAVLEMLRMVREVDPAKPSTKVSTADALPSIAANRAIEPERLKRELRGDLDWIALKALEKDRTRRYETANGLAADILRHLASEPVQAAPPSRSYRARKFVGKHRVGVGAAGLVLLALVAGIAGTTLGLVAARHAAEAERLAKLDALANERKAVAAAEGERLAKLDAQGKKALAESNEERALAAAEAEKQAKETVEDVLGFVENKVFAAARPKGQEGGLGYDVKLADAITAALPGIEGDFPGKPLTEARLRHTIGMSFKYLGKLDLAAAQLKAALALSSQHQGVDHPNSISSINNLAAIYTALARQDEALKLYEQALTLEKAKLGPDHPNTLAGMSNLAATYAALGRRDEALKLTEQALTLQKEKLGLDHPSTLASMSNLANTYVALGRHDEALKLSEEVQTSNNAKLGSDHPVTLQSMNNLANVYFALGRRDEAIKLREQALTLQKAKLGPDHPETLQSMNGLASTYVNMGRYDEAAKLFREALTLQKAKLGPDHPETLQITNNLAAVVAALGRLDEAIKLLEEVLMLRKAKHGPDHPGTLQSMNNLANIYFASGRQDKATKLFEEVLMLQKANLGPDHPGTIQSMNNLANFHFASGRPDEATKLVEEVLMLQKAKLGPDHPGTLQSMNNLANIYFANGREREALTLLKACSIATPKDTNLAMKVAALQVWHGLDEEFAASRRRILANAAGTEETSTAERAAKLSSLLPSADGPDLDAAIGLGHRAVELGKGGGYREFDLMSLGMAEYRGGKFVEALATLDAARASRREHPENGGKLNYCFDGTTAFFRAMSLFRLGKTDEARALAIETAAKVKPLPAEGQYPLVKGADHDDLVLWLAYREAKALIGFDPPPATPAKPEGR